MGVAANEKYVKSLSTVIRSLSPTSKNKGYQEILESYYPAIKCDESSEDDEELSELQQMTNDELLGCFAILFASFVLATLVRLMGKAHQTFAANRGATTAETAQAAGEPPPSIASLDARLHEVQCAIGKLEGLLTRPHDVTI